MTESAWRLSEDRDVASLEVRALAMPFGALVALIVGTVIVGGATAIFTLVALTPDSSSPLTRSSVVLVSGCIGLVLFFVVAFVFRLCATTMRVTASSAGIEVSAGRKRVAAAWGAVDRLLLRSGTDYSRVHLVVGSRRVTALVGASMLVQYRAGADALAPPDELRAWCTSAGLLPRVGPRRSPGVADFRRAIGDLAAR